MQVIECRTGTHAPIGTVTEETGLTAQVAFVAQPHSSFPSLALPFFPSFFLFCRFPRWRSKRRVCAAGTCKAGVSSTRRWHKASDSTWGRIGTQNPLVKGEKGDAADKNPAEAQGEWGNTRENNEERKRQGHERVTGKQKKKKNALGAQESCERQKDGENGTEAGLERIMSGEHGQKGGERELGRRSGVRTKKKRRGRREGKEDEKPKEEAQGDDVVDSKGRRR